MKYNQRPSTASRNPNPTDPSMAVSMSMSVTMSMSMSMSMSVTMSVTMSGPDQRELAIASLGPTCCALADSGRRAAHRECTAFGRVQIDA
ncbi:hypothetical protein [Maricaulis sp.]|uniref:hypothetical protein n=1 Tax=Maricaulis sp. TaxID=1486257 RepID=UPI0025B9A966|nr:hypothetical protein [Maricaulis sp.]